MGAEIRFWEDAPRNGFDAVFAMDFEGGDRTGVVEYGIVEITARGLSAFHTGRCSPSAEIPFREQDTHGLSAHDLEGYVPFADFWELFRNLRKKGPFLAHSAQIEDRFLRRQWRTPGEVPNWADRRNPSFEWGPWLDSCGIFRSLCPGQPAGLSDLIEAEKLKDELEALGQEQCPEGRCRWHAALYDTIASGLLFQRALEARPDWSLRRFFRESGGGRDTAVEQVGLW